MRFVVAKHSLPIIKVFAPNCRRFNLELQVFFMDQYLSGPLTTKKAKHRVVLYFFNPIKLFLFLYI